MLVMYTNTGIYSIRSFFVIINFLVMFEHSFYSKKVYILLQFVLSLNKIQTQLIILDI
jgi:hypothetical protein